MTIASPKFSNYNLQNIKLNFPNCFKVREQDVNKSTFGSVGIIGGNNSTIGAAVLASMSALKSGCGKVFIAFISNVEFSYIYSMPEIMVCSIEEIIQKQLTNIVIGCGLGISKYSLNVLNKILQLDNINLVLDADALNIISHNEDIMFKNSLSQKRVLTPHIGEASRLLDCSIEQIQANKIQSALLISQKFNCCTILKCFNSVISTACGKYWINSSGNNALSTAGTGDVLAGSLGSLLAQKIPLEEAIRCATWIHGAAADYLVEQKIGPIGLTASEFINAMRFIRNHITYGLL